jgi:hypothetical protein
MSSNFKNKQSMKNEKLNRTGNTDYSSLTAEQSNAVRLGRGMPPRAWVLLARK